MAEHNYYAEQLILQQNISRISTAAAAVFLTAAVFLLIRRIEKKRKWKKNLRVVLIVLFLSTVSVQQCYAEVPPAGGAAWADITVISGFGGSAAFQYGIPVTVQVHWKNADTSGQQYPLRIGYSTELYAESMELDPGYGTSVEAQLQSLGISWITLVEEKGIGESEEGKLLQFSVTEAGEYHFETVGRTLDFSIEASVAEAPRTAEQTLDFGAETEPAADSEAVGADSPENEKGEAAAAEKAVAQEAETEEPSESKKEKKARLLKLDQTPPEIRISGVKNGGCYDFAVIPMILVEDSFFSSEGLTCSLTGARSGSLDPADYSKISITEKGASIVMQDFPADTDDVYTLSVRAADQAGNTAEEKVVFSVDQEGSSYIFSDETQALVDAYVIAEPVDLVLSEMNVSPVEYRISVSKDGVPAGLTENQDYSVEVHGGDGEWMIYLYRIYASNFEEEGIYHVEITSRDQASNVNNTQVRGARIDFAVDRTPPALLVEGLENAAVYTEAEHKFAVRSADQTGLSWLRVRSNGQVIGEVTDPEEQETFVLKAEEEEQLVQIQARDSAGNLLPAEEYRVTVQNREEGENSGKISVGRMLWIAASVLILSAAAVCVLSQSRRLPPL